MEEVEGAENIENAEASGEVVVELAGNSLGDLFEKGGVMMYPILALSIATLFLVIFYLVTINQRAIYTKLFLGVIQKHISLGKFDEALEAAQSENTAISQVVEKTCAFIISNKNAQVEEIMQIAEAEASKQASKLSSRISYLADIGSIAPMLGLLGTVMGMIDSFLKISQGGIEGAKPMQLAAGVSEALITTASGLIVGVIALSVYTVYRGKVTQMISTIDSTTSYLTSQISASVRKG